MPTIKKQRNKSRYIRHDNNKVVHDIYNTNKWKQLREWYIMNNPLCEKCQEKGIIKSAEEIHHITPISKGKDKLEMMDFAYNPNNLIALCKECHHNIHKQMSHN